LPRCQLGNAATLHHIYGYGYGYPAYSYGYGTGYSYPAYTGYSYQAYGYGYGTPVTATRLSYAFGTDIVRRSLYAAAWRRWR